MYVKKIDSSESISAIIARGLDIPAPRIRAIYKRNSFFMNEDIVAICDCGKGRFSVLLYPTWGGGIMILKENITHSNVKMAATTPKELWPMNSFANMTPIACVALGVEY